MKSEDPVNTSDDKFSSAGYEKDAQVTSDAEIGHGEVLIETTHRGLKARHAQMIALGGTIGTFPCHCYQYNF
jgi:amino acid transporter